jgi:hypothetical protein
MCQTCGDDDTHQASEEAARASLRVRHFHLILADIAVAAAARSLRRSELVLAPGSYRPGAIRDLWQEIAPDDATLRRVNALANAGTAALQQQDAGKLLDAAIRYGIPLDATLAADIAGHFAERRDAVMTYDH